MGWLASGPHDCILFLLFLYCPGLPRFASQPEPSSVYAGNSAILNCEVNADLVPFVRWEQNRHPLLLDGRVIKLPSGTLVISNATERDGGLYRCLIESGGPPKYSDEAELKVLPGIHLSSGLIIYLLMGKICSVRIFISTVKNVMWHINVSILMSNFLQGGKEENMRKIHTLVNAFVSKNLPSNKVYSMSIAFFLTKETLALCLFVKPPRNRILLWVWLLPYNRILFIVRSFNL